MLYARQYSYLRLMMWADAFCAGAGLLCAYGLRFLLAEWCAANASGLPGWFPSVVPYEAGYFWKELLWTLPACMLAWPLALGHCGFYAPEKQKGYGRRVGLLLRGCLWAVAALVILIFVLKLQYTARTVIVGTGFLTAGLLWGKEWLLRRHPVFQEESDDFHLLVLRAGAEEPWQSEVLAAYGEWGARTVQVLEMAGLGEEALTGALIAGKVDEVVCFCREEELPGFWPLLRQGGRLGLKTVCYYAKGADYARLNFEEGDAVAAVSLNKTSPDLGALTLKMLLDRLLALLGLLLLSPVFAVIALVVKHDSAGPVFWRQTRVGRNGHLFTLYKFRSMVENAEERKGELLGRNEVEGWAFKIEDDPRVTWSGRFLRRYSLDELPQLWNVLKGDMSLVGPRPALPEEVERFAPGERRRLSMKPGLTGLWQVSGRHRLPIERWIALDLEYIDRWSLPLDLSIICRTFAAVFRGEGS